MSTPATTCEPVLELRGVDVPAPADPERMVVRNLDWRVMRGEFWLVTGASGSGKTSVLHVAAGLIRPARGRHWLFGEDLAELKDGDQERLRARVGMVFGGGGRLFAHLTVAENLALPLFYHGRHRTEAGLGRIAALLEEFDLGGHAHRLPREIPRRMAERVALARALVLEPEVLLVDDAAGGMVAAEVDWWRARMGECAGGTFRLGLGITTLVVAATDPGPWRDLADREASVRGGVWDSGGGTVGRDPVLRPAPAG